MDLTSRATGRCTWRRFAPHVIAVVLSGHLPPKVLNSRMTTSFWLAAAAYLVPTFPLGYLWHLKAFRSDYERLAVYREPVIIPLGLASMVVQAGLYAWAYPRLFSTAHDAWLQSAVFFGAFFGALAWSLAVLPAAAKNRMASVGTFLRLETAFTVVQYAVISPLIALAWRAPA
jgi:hypothetical protein